MRLQSPEKAASTFQCERYFRLHPFGFPKDGSTLHLDRHKTDWLVKLYGYGLKEWHLRFVPSSDLASMLALLVAGLVPVGVVADRLQDEFPDTEPACSFLRRWEEAERLMSAVEPIMKWKGTE